MNRTPPEATTTEGIELPTAQLEIIGTLARTYDAQRLRLLSLLQHGDPKPATLTSSLRPLGEIESEVWLDGREVSASIVDAVVQAEDVLAGRAVVPPLHVGDEGVMAAEAGWWDALLGDVERRSGLAPRSIGIELPGEVPASVRAVFADRVAR